MREFVSHWCKVTHGKVLVVLWRASVQSVFCCAQQLRRCRYGWLIVFLTLEKKRRLRVKTSMLFFFSSRAVIWIPDRLKENFKILPSHHGCILAECSTVLQLILPSGLFCYKRMARLRILKCIFILKVKKKFSISSVCVTESASLQWILDTCVSLWILSHQS